LSHRVSFCGKKRIRESIKTVAASYLRPRTEENAASEKIDHNKLIKEMLNQKKDKHTSLEEDEILDSKFFREWTGENS
jgi:hypothetical protein